MMKKVLKKINYKLYFDICLGHVNKKCHHGNYIFLKKKLKKNELQELKILHFCVILCVFSTHNNANQRNFIYFFNNNYIYFYLHLTANRLKS